MSIFNAKFAPDVFEPVKAPILARCQSLWVRSCFGLRVILCYLLWPQGFTYVRRKGTPSKKSVNLDKFGGILCNKVGRHPSSDARTAVAHILLLWRDQVLLTRKVDLVVFEVERLQANFAWYFPNIIAYYALLRNFLPAVGPIEVHWSSSKMHSCWRIPLQGDHEGIHVFLLDPHHSWFTVILLIPPLRCVSLIEVSVFIRLSGLVDTNSSATATCQHEQHRFHKTKARGIHLKQQLFSDLLLFPKCPANLYLAGSVPFSYWENPMLPLLWRENGWKLRPT